MSDQNNTPNSSSNAVSNSEPHLRTALYDFHLKHGAKIVPFAGYEMPVQYPLGVMKEHLHTRAHAGLFDVSHMGQAFITADDSTFETAAAFVETIVPRDISTLKPGEQKYTQLLNADGGILDDLMVTRLGLEGYEHMIYLVVNAGCKADDFAHISNHLPAGISLRVSEDLSLLALQGPEAATIMGAYDPRLAALDFMHSLDLMIEGHWCHISRSGYTGEDGYEISTKHVDALALAELLVADERVEPIGLGARDSLRLEAGLCLYGHEIDTTTSPVEAGLIWSIPKSRRTGEGYLGAARIAADLKNKPKRRLVGILPDGRAPAREGTQIQNEAGEVIGHITSGGFGPSTGGPVAMGYVKRRYAKSGTDINLIIRGKAKSAKTVKLPFVAKNFYKKED